VAAVVRPARGSTEVGAKAVAEAALARAAEIESLQEDADRKLREKEEEARRQREQHQAELLEARREYEEKLKAQKEGGAAGDFVEPSSPEGKLRAAERADRARKEQEALSAEFVPIANKRRDLLRAANKSLEMLLATAGQIKKFNDTHGKTLPSPDEITPKALDRLKVDLEVLDAEVKMLKTRTQSDGLLLALKSYLKTQGWSAIQLGKKITSGNTFTIAQLTGFLAVQQIQYDENALSFMLQAMGSALHVGMGQADEVPPTDVKVEKLVYALESLGVKPLQI